jgi:hypothetical protein
MDSDGFLVATRFFPYKPFRLKIWSILYPVTLFIAGEGGAFLFLRLSLLWRFGPFSGYGVPDCLLPTFSVPCCLPV